MAGLCAGLAPHCIEQLVQVLQLLLGTGPALKGSPHAPATRHCCHGRRGVSGWPPQGPWASRSPPEASMGAHGYAGRTEGSRSSENAQLHALGLPVAAGAPSLPLNVPNLKGGLGERGVGRALASSRRETASGSCHSRPHQAFISSLHAVSTTPLTGRRAGRLAQGSAGLGGAGALARRRGWGLGGKGAAPQSREPLCT